MWLVTLAYLVKCQISNKCLTRIGNWSDKWRSSSRTSPLCHPSVHSSSAFSLRDCWLFVLFCCIIEVDQWAISISLCLASTITLKLKNNNSYHFQPNKKELIQFLQFNPTPFFPYSLQNYLLLHFVNALCLHESVVQLLNIQRGGLDLLLEWTREQLKRLVVGLFDISIQNCTSALRSRILFSCSLSLDE